MDMMHLEPIEQVLRALLPRATFAEIASAMLVCVELGEVAEC